MVLPRSANNTRSAVGGRWPPSVSPPHKTDGGVVRKPSGDGHSDNRALRKNCCGRKFRSIANQTSVDVASSHKTTSDSLEASRIVKGHQRPSRGIKECKYFSMLINESNNYSSSLKTANRVWEKMGEGIS